MSYLVRRTFNGHQFWVGRPNAKGRVWSKASEDGMVCETVEEARTVIRSRSISASVVPAEDPHGEALHFERVYKPRRKKRRAAGGSQ